jgi:hypothetical protein
VTRPQTEVVPIHENWRLIGHPLAAALAILMTTLAVALIIGGVAVSAPAQELTPHDKLAYEQALSNFNRGRGIMRLCSYAASDFGAHDSCGMRLLWGGVQSLPFSLLDGRDFQVFLDYYAINSIFTPAVVFGIDRRVLQSFKGSVRAYCNFYRIDCKPLVQWYQENMNHNRKNVKANID